MNTGEPQRPFAESQRAMNSESDSRSRLYPKYSFGSYSSPFFFSSSPCSRSIIRLKPVPTGSTKTRSVNASHDSSFSTSCGGIRGSEPSDGNATRCGPTAQDERPRALETAVVGDVRDGEELGGGLVPLAKHGPPRLRRVFAAPPRRGRLRAARRLVVGLRFLLLVGHDEDPNRAASAVRRGSGRDRTRSPARRG